MIYAIAHYPTQLIDVWWSRNGPRITVRPILPQDAQLSQAFVRSLSQRSRYRRFLGALNELSPTMLERFTQIDYRNHLALVAETFAEGEPVLIGEARYASAGDPRSAEFALAVADAWQRQGIGSLLLHNLLRSAAAAGVRHLYGDVLHDNRPMLTLAYRAGFASAPHPEDGRLVHVAIDPTAAASPVHEQHMPRRRYVQSFTGRRPGLEIGRRGRESSRHPASGIRSRALKRLSTHFASHSGAPAFFAAPRFAASTPGVQEAAP